VSRRDMSSRARIFGPASVKARRSLGSIDVSRSGSLA
jgi:hypothetical protein